MEVLFLKLQYVRPTERNSPTKKNEKKNTTENKVQFGCSLVPVRVKDRFLEKVSNGVTDLYESSPARI